ncbi:hypothetical protein PSAB6_540049 [Paraburkholderia sabiae]|nr:hypothetical protein PSAB6_540049 [Paraburkholderia sabiae]
MRTRTWPPGFFRFRIARPFAISVTLSGSDILNTKQSRSGCRRGYRYNVRRVDVFVTLERVHENPGASQESG